MCRIIVSKNIMKEGDIIIMMRVLLNTSIIVEIDRHDKIVLNLLEKLAKKDIEVFISTVTISEIISEILTGSYD